MENSQKNMTKYVKFIAKGASFAIVACHICAVDLVELTPANPRNFTRQDPASGPEFFSYIREFDHFLEATEKGKRFKSKELGGRLPATVAEFRQNNPAFRYKVWYTEEAHEDNLRRVEVEKAAELEVLRRYQEEQLRISDQEHAVTIKAQHEASERAQEELKRQHIADLQVKQEAHDREVEELRRSSEEALQAARAASAGEAEVLAAQHARELQVKQEAHDRAVEELRRSSEEALQAARAASAGEAEVLAAQHARELQVKQEAHDRELEELRRSSEEALQAARAASAREIEALEVRHLQELDAVREAHGREIARLSNSYDHRLLAINEELLRAKLSCVICEESAARNQLDAELWQGFSDFYPPYYGGMHVPQYPLKPQCVPVPVMILPLQLTMAQSHMHVHLPQPYTHIFEWEASLRESYYGGEQAAFAYMEILRMQELLRIERLREFHEREAALRCDITQLTEYAGSLLRGKDEFFSRCMDLENQLALRIRI